ncbi:helix-turn-helix domain-containing protein [Salinispora cortesiana]|uniref:helix-turn-helix domain-containing protein n=1 Tax=Salinispora cortesiana TaxID=1305843 RepID=UPI0004160452|nr:helix-turn-helix transcriptional regulator [Salinispora cortesiana]
MDANKCRPTPTHPIWQSPELRAAVARDDAGTVIRLVRQAAGLTQGELGNLCGYSGSTISRLERAPLHDISLRRQLAHTLSIPAVMLGLSDDVRRHDGRAVPTSDASNPEADKLRRSGNGEGGDLMRRRTFLTGAAITTVAGLTTSPEPVPTTGLEALLFTDAAALPTAPDTLTAGLAAASRAYADSRYTELTRGLPSLLAGLHTARGQATGLQRETLAGHLARAYMLASSVCTKLGDDAIAWVLADRALTASRDTGNGLVVAAATHTIAIAMRREGHHDGALHLLTTTAEGLGADRSADAALITAYGKLLCTAAYSSAQAGNASSAATFIDEAAAAASRLGGTTMTGTVVPLSPATVAIYKIGVYTALGETGAALRSAETIRPAELPSTERYGRFCVDTARAWTHHGKPDRAVQALLSAERYAPEEVNRPSVRDLVSSLLYAPTATSAGLRNLATRVGAAI